MPWTRFMDMSSGGGRKEPFSKLYIEAPEAEAKAVFFNRFGHNPERVTCTCCGDDYSINEHPTLREATAYDRGCGFEGDEYVEKPSKRQLSDHYVTLEEYVAGERDVNGWLLHDGEKEPVAFIYAADIKPKERVGEVPAQGYVWVE